MKVIPATLSVLILGFGVGSLLNSAMPTHKPVLTEPAIGDGAGAHLDQFAAIPPAVIAPRENTQQSPPTAHSAERQDKQTSSMDAATNCSAGTKACGMSCISIEKACRPSDERMHRGVACGKSYIAAGKVCSHGSKNRKRYEPRIAKLKPKQ